jgi:hypothetical protein
VRSAAVLACLGGRDATFAGGRCQSRLPDREILHGIGRGTSQLPIPPNTGRSADGDSARMSPVRTSRPDPRIHRVQMGRERIAEGIRRDVRVRGAARMGEEAGVVGLRDGLAVDAEPVGEPHRNQGAMQAVLEREPHAEVRRQAQRRDQLRASDLRAALRRFG